MNLKRETAAPAYKRSPVATLCVVIVALAVLIVGQQFELASQRSDHERARSIAIQVLDILALVGVYGYAKTDGCSTTITVTRYWR